MPRKHDPSVQRLNIQTTLLVERALARHQKRLERLRGQPVSRSDAARDAIIRTDDTKDLP
jgi:hypothetical protein